jgi:hypothetical protein
MSEELLHLIEYHLVNFAQSTNSADYLTGLFDENPWSLLHILSILVLRDMDDLRGVVSASVLMSRVLKPSITRPVTALSDQYHELEISQRVEIKQALFKCLMYQDALIVRHGASGLSGVAAFEFVGYTPEWPDLYEQLGNLYTDGHAGSYSPVGALMTMREILKARILPKRRPALQLAVSIVIQACLTSLSESDSDAVRLEAASTLRVAIRRFCGGIPDPVWGATLDLLLAGLGADGEIHTIVTRSLSKLLTIMHLHLSADIVGPIVTRTVEAFESPNEQRKADYIGLWTKFVRYEADHGPPLCFAPAVCSEIAPYLIGVLGEDATVLDDSKWNLTRACHACLFLFARTAPDVLLQKCAAQLSEADENALVKTFLIFQVIANINLEQAVQIYMDAFPRLVEFAGTAPARLSRAAFAVLHTGINCVQMVRTDENLAAILQVVRVAIESPDPAIVRRALFIVRTVFQGVRGTPFVEACAQPFMELFEAVLGTPAALDEAVLEEAFTALAVFVQCLSRTAVEIVTPLSALIGERFAATFESDSALAVVQRVGLAESVRILALRNDNGLAEFVAPYLKLLFQSWDPENQQPGLLGAMAAIFGTMRCDQFEPFTRDAIMLGMETLRNGNRPIVCAGAQLIARAVSFQHMFVIDLVTEVLELGCSNLVNYESDSQVVAAMVEMISVTMCPSLGTDASLAEVVFPARAALMDLFASVAAALPRMPDDESRALAFAALLRGYEGIALLYRVEEAHMRPGEFLGSYEVAFQSLPRIGMTLGLDGESIAAAFLRFMRAIIPAFGMANQFNVVIHKTEFQKYMEMASRCESPNVKQLYPKVKQMWDQA